MATLNDLRDTGISFDGGLDIIAPNGETVYRKETCELDSPSSILIQSFRSLGKSL